MTQRVLFRDAQLPGSQLGVTTGVLCEAGAIVSIGDSIQPSEETETIDCDGRSLIPGFVDCHTHACWAGDRLDEWEQKLAGVSYLKLLERGGGIMATVRAVRGATFDDLVENLLHRLGVMLRHGTTTAEVKSGYGLDTSTELKMLAAINEASQRWPGTLVPTACIGHARDPELYDGGVSRTLNEVLPEVSKSFPGITIDAYCERGAWSLEETTALLDRAREAGHSIRLHADQFNSIGGVEAAIARDAVSVDHLEASSAETLRCVADSDSFGVMLPACGLHLDDRYADGRSLLDAGGRLAIATNYNPGSAPCPSMPMVIALAVRKLGITIAEALEAATQSPATLLGFSDRGQVSVGSRSDLCLLESNDPRTLAFEFGGNPVVGVWCSGQRVV